MFENVSVIIPVVRPEKAKAAIKSVELHCPGAEIIAIEDKERIGCPKMVENMVSASNRPLVMFLGDDATIMAGALQNAIKKMDTLPDGWGLVGFNTKNNKHFAHWLADRRMILLTNGQLFNTAYKHNYCDHELYDIAVENERWAFAEDAIVHHAHPGNGADMDDFYEYGRSTMDEDRKTYYRRKRERKQGRLAIGFPLVDDRVPVQFFTSYTCMEKPSQYRLLVPQFPHGPWKSSIADARNSLVQQALDEGCSHLLMLDTDQTYPSECLTRLMSHKKDICGVRVHRRWMPFDPIFLRGEIGKYVSVPDDEAYSGELIEVDATGTGCLLFNMDIFLEIQDPWFEFSFHNGKPVGEDINFCSKARKAGIKIYIDSAVEVGHLTTMEVNKALHQLCKHISTSTINMV